VHEQPPDEAATPSAASATAASVGEAVVPIAHWLLLVLLVARVLRVEALLLSDALALPEALLLSDALALPEALLVEALLLSEPLALAELLLAEALELPELLLAELLLSPSELPSRPLSAPPSLPLFQAAARLAPFGVPTPLGPSQPVWTVQSCLQAPASLMFELGPAGLTG
jgi:hypothetical protein